ncbi:MAG: DUF4197 domain-containing protein [Bacteroidales bacterium]
MMKRFLTVVLLLIPIAFWSCDVLQEVAGSLEEYGGQTGLTREEVTAGLKEALKVGSVQAVNTLSARDGYFGNALYRIGFPPEAAEILKHKDHPLLQAAGISEKIDQVEINMNRAAEQAAGKAVPVFTDAITAMTIGDAFAILNGSDTAATHYFRQHTYSKLEQLYRPVVNQALDKKFVGNISANQAWSALTDSYNQVASVTGWKKVNRDLSTWVTRRGLDGLFLRIREEEKNIRNNPQARVTEILRKVFGNN